MAVVEHRLFAIPPRRDARFRTLVPNRTAVRIRVIALVGQHRASVCNPAIRPGRCGLSAASTPSPSVPPDGPAGSPRHGFWCRTRRGYDPTPRPLDRRCRRFFFRTGGRNRRADARAINAEPFGIVVPQLGGDLLPDAVAAPAVVPLPEAVGLAVNRLEDRCTPATAYLATDLVADTPGIAPLTDPTLVNAWGIAPNPGGPLWVSANGTDLSEVYLGTNPLSAAFRVTIPGGAPTGQVFNNSGSTTDFQVSDGTHTAAAAFIFASEAGEVTGWAPTVGGGTTTRPAEVGFPATDGAVYKGIAIGKSGTSNLLYLADFHNGKIDVLNGQFQKVTLGTGGFGTFTDPTLPAGYAPFNVATINGMLYVSYAKQDAAAHDDVSGPGHGFIDVFDLTGHLQQRLVSGGALNSPWGMTVAPAGFGDFAGALLVGNFGNGLTHAYNATTGALLGTLSVSPGHPIVIDGLWGLAFGIAAGTTNTLFYAAGPDHEAHGLFGKISANPAGTNPVSASLAGGTLTITGSRDDDNVSVTLEGKQIVVRSGGGEDDHGEDENGGDGGTVIGRFNPADVNLITFNGFAGNDTFTVSPKVTATALPPSEPERVGCQSSIRLPSSTTEFATNSSADRGSIGSSKARSTRSTVAGQVSR